MRILILGAGAVGGYFGARLVEAGADVSFLVRPGRAESLRREGLRVESPCGAFHCFPRILEAASAAAPTRLVILACKAYDLPSAMAAVAPALGQDTLIVPLLNGIRHLTTLDDAFGRRRVAGGIAHLAVTLTEDGNIRHLSPAHRLIVGARDDAQASRLDEFAALATTANFAFAASADIVREMWEKLVFLATLAGATCRYRRPIGQITATASGLKFVGELFAECQAIAAACGIALDIDTLASYWQQLTLPGSRLTSSMSRDLARGSRIEREAIFDYLIGEAEARQLAVPALSWVRQILAGYRPAA